MSKSLSEEFASKVEIGKPYIVVKESGKEFSIIVDAKGEHVWYGRAALSRVIVLHGSQGHNPLVAAVVDTQTASDWTKANEIYFSAHVHIASGFMVTVKIGDVSLIEQPWRIFVPASIVTPEGDIISESELVTMFPGMKRFMLPEGGFAKNPLLGKNDAKNMNLVQFPPPVSQVIKADEEVESEER